MIREELTADPFHDVCVPSSLTEEFAHVYRFIADPAQNIQAILRCFQQVSLSAWHQIWRDGRHTAGSIPDREDSESSLETYTES